MKKLWKCLPFLGAALILVSALLLLLPALRERQRDRILTELEQRIPPRTTGYAGIYSDPAMPALELEGTDYLGILDIPGYGVKLPVAADWESGKLGTHPCRFWGSAYDGTLVIGGSGDPGQLDFCGRVNIGDRIRFTDMTGAEFDYEVTWVDRAKEAQDTWLTKEECDLTVFTRDPYSLQYIALRCDLLMD